MDPSKPVTQIGKYAVLAELGRGGMGVVYRAEDQMIGREVAIKTLTEATPELRERFLIEARSGVLNHQNIVTVYDFGEQDNSPYIVMEFLRGDSLERILKSGRTMQLVEILDIVRQVCEGLGYAHSKGVVHRDIKPGNVMVQPNGHAKIVDFGIARLEKEKGHTQTGAVIGTFHYISPERLKGEPSDGRADIWACGVMLYFMLTGRLPFPGEDISASHRVVNEPFEPISNFVSNVPASVEAVVQRALEKNPDDRYDVAEEMAGDLEAINEGLKRSRVGEVLIQVKSLLDREELTEARPMLMDLQRLDPQNTEVKRLLREVQDKLSRQQKSEQIRQMVVQGDKAVEARNFLDAMELYRQASKLDPTNTDLANKANNVRELKDRFDRVETLKNQAREARSRNDFHSAAQAISEAITLDSSSTDLRNEHAGILQEQERAARAGTLRKLKEQGRQQLGDHQFTQAVQILHSALELDPKDAETQQLYQDAIALQEENRRRKIIEQIVVEIQDQIFRGEYDRALELINRSLEKLPGESQLLRLRAETRKKQEESLAQKLVEETSIKVQSLFLTDPQEALACVQQALDKMPGEPYLLEMQERVVTQLKKANLDGLRAQYLKRAQAALDETDYSQAIQTLETAMLDCGESPEVRGLYDYAQAEKKSSEHRRTTGEAIQKAQQLIGEGDLKEAIEVLTRATQETNDPAILQMLRQAQERFDEVGRRVDAVLGRIQTLSATDPAQALQLLLSQPQAIQQHPQMRALRSKLDARSEQEQTTKTAISRSGEQLKQLQYREGLDTLEAVRQAYGDFPQLANAIADYKIQRAALAKDTLGQAITSGRQALLAQEARRAIDILSKVGPSAEFCEKDLQADWTRLLEEATRAAKLKRGDTANLPIVVKGTGIAGKWIAVAVAGVVAVVIAAVLFLRQPPPVGTSYLQMNATPYAEVVSITPSKGSALKLGEGSHMTPLRMDAVALGTYSVVFRGADGSSHTETCVVSDDSHLCSMQSTPLSDSDIDAIVKGAQ
ncbi:serine/threonine-protein kinase [Granulicella paludicola]|uniref:serine/threonine-protein kinase n=1 Tax=Granulicella paludicola TaxID=474951 RepID=UPI0021DF8B25|nr:serine/threonine-protein kinase [Granulicella paludicola]